MVPGYGRCSWAVVAAGCLYSWIGEGGLALVVQKLEDKVEDKEERTQGLGGKGSALSRQAVWVASCQYHSVIILIAGKIRAERDYTTMCRHIQLAR